MNRIRLLPEQVANQIAAGEVVERPASVVKELVENALDAQAARLTVEIQAGGRSLIRVTDDGTGMSRDDALLCLERHATSKIRTADDLGAISTMGFRGEALPSIASVSRFTLTTRERENESGEATQVIVNGGKIVEVRAAGAAAGTTVEVRQLFFNVPARRKFLRSDETERAHIQHYLTLAALAFPEVALTFVNDARQVWQLPAQAKGDEATAQLAALKERLRALHGAELPLLAVDYSQEYEGSAEPGARPGEAPIANRQSAIPFRVWGFIGAPGVSRATREDQSLFVNRRPVENRGLNFALLEGYHTALMKGRYPVCCLFLEIDPAEVDVNIHPAKREVKFHHEAAVRRGVAQAVRETLLNFHAAPQLGTAVPPTPSRPTPVPLPVGTQAHAAAPPPTTQPPAQPETKEFPSLLRPPLQPPPSPPPLPPRAPLPPTPPVPHLTDLTHLTHFTQPAAPATLPKAPPPPTTAVPLLQVPLRLIGVVGRLYVVLESDRGLVLMDQHAAHERILFEQMLRRLEQGPAPSQRLLLPETIELSVRDMIFLRENLAVLTRLGVGLSEFGERTFLLDALPPFVKASGPRRFVLELIDGLKAAGQEVNSLRLGEETVAKTVCRHAVKANDPLGVPELEQLLEDLRHCAMPYTCPHGRPTLIEMNFRELEKKFGRIA
ncbi:MAG: DNA mismatch repair endonuclease MutL [Verrucomicrobia bacterium]|nr:DNA mismatch repair endonuclease MutL [Verrucomicrobiota bacterium]